jgi:hypothetical protein
MAIHATERVSDPDAVISIVVDITRLAIWDLLRGPYGSEKRIRDYRTAVTYLHRVGLLEVVLEHYRLIHDPGMEVLVDELD